MIRGAMVCPESGTKAVVMPLACRNGLFVAVSVAAVQLLLVVPTKAQVAARSLPDSVTPHETFTVSMALTVPGGTGVVGVEDRPPPGWMVSNISDGGSFDGVSMSVKWGPFFDPSIPALVSYDLTAPGSWGGLACFEGTASFDGNDIAVSGDACLPPPVPAASFWGLVILAILLAGMGTLVLRPPAMEGRSKSEPG